jgi:NAD(P)H-dependent FMN reductase
VALRERLTEALLSWNEAKAAAAWDEAVASFDVLTVFSQIAAPALQTIGDRWHAGTASVAQEHFATNFVRSRLAQVDGPTEAGRNAATVVLACVGGEHHEIGLLMLAALLRFSGCRVLYLGADVPLFDLGLALLGSHPNVAAVHAGTAAGARAFIEAVPELHRAAPATAFVHGGRGFEAGGPPEVSGSTYGGDDLGAALTLIHSLARKAGTGGSP